MAETKKIFDALHGFINLNNEESYLVEHKYFRRLFDIKQLGVAYLVYPGASHSRYEHSLGTMFVADQIFERILEKCSAFYQLKDLCDRSDYYRNLLKMAALSHDLGHLPYSHTAESRVFREKSHEWMTAQLLFSNTLDLKEAQTVAKIAIGPKKCAELSLDITPFTPVEKLLAQIITDDFFGADRIDYLLRDGKCSGLPYGQFDSLQLIERLTVVESRNECVLAVEEGALQACESMMLARYFMYSRVYHHTLVKSLSFHLSFLVEKVIKDQNALKSVDHYTAVSDCDVLMAIKMTKESDPLYDHARALLDPRWSYETIKFSDDEVAAYQNPQFQLEMNPQVRDKMTFDFAVQRKNSQVVHAEALSNITVPSMHSHFAYKPRDMKKGSHD